MSKTRHLNGLAAEDIAERHYLSQGFETLEKRWRSEAGEIDLIMGSGNLIVFVEAKARKTHAIAAHSISAKQWARIMASGELYVSKRGLPASVDLRFDAALIDRSGVCEIIENAPIF